MTKKDYFVPVYDDEGKITSIMDNSYYPTEITSMERVIEILNEQEATIRMWCNSSKKITQLLKENTKPTTTDRGRDVYLDIDLETKRCKYENTFICSNCEYYSTYFLDCRLMMEDHQYKKALKLGLIRELKE